MKAIVYTEFGPPDVLHIGEVEKPSPKDNEILVKVRAVSVGYGDLLGRNFKALNAATFNMLALFLFLARLDFGFSKPKKKILGSEFSGEVEAIGSNVQKFKVGDQVFGYLGQKMGSYAEYLCMSENGSVALKPSNMSHEEATSIPYGGLMALNLLRQVKVKKDWKILVNGASGGIGSAAVQLAKHHFGAEVTGVCGTSTVEFVRSLGADRVIDYRKEDFTQNGQTYNLIFDILGKTSFAKCKNSLVERGIYLRASFKTKQLWQMLWTKIRGGKRVICALAMDKQDDLVFIKELVENGKFTTFIDKSFSMDRAADAHRYVEQGNRKGKVVINMNE